MTHTGINKKRIFLSFFVLLMIIFTVGASLFTPGYYIDKIKSADEGISSAVPTEYYSGPSDAIVKNASLHLSEEQCISLIYGEWESDISDADPSDCTKSEYEIVSAYDYGIHSEYQNWYTWKAKPYKAVDTTFKTYAAIFWKITFTKYDGTDIRTYYVTEGGTILEVDKIPYDFQ